MEKNKISKIKSVTPSGVADFGPHCATHPFYFGPHCATQGR